jgi:hypothetical protein
MSDTAQLVTNRFGPTRELADESVRLDARWMEILLVGIAAGALLAQGLIACFHKINWDEFYFLARILEFRRGELSNPMQTFHVHLFGWLAMLPGNDIHRIIAARISMLAFQAGTLCAIFLTAKHFASRTGALCAVAAYATCANVMLRGASFRFDPIVTFLLMAAIALLVGERLRWYLATLAGLLVAIAALVTIKSVLYVPSLLAVALWRIFSAQDSRSAAFSMVVAAGVSAAALCLLFLFHLHSLGGLSPAGGPEAFVLHSASSMIGFGSISPTWPYILFSIVGGPVLWAGIAAGTLFCIRHTVKGRISRPRMLVLLSFLFPLAAVLFYRNAFPYYYVFAFAPASVLVAFATDALVWPARQFAIAICVMCALATQTTASALSRTMEAQHSVMAAVHEIFPKPVPYIDRCSMIGSFPKEGFFMSTWMMDTYRKDGTPDFSRIIEDQHPVFVLTNTPTLRAALNATEMEPDQALLSRDASALRNNYIRHWGPIWVAGKRFTEAGPSSRDFEMPVAGNYTVEAEGGVVIDGKPASPGDVVHFEAGRHGMTASAGSFPVVLRWGDHLPMPSAAAPKEAVFNGF